ncbi:hypothetical protein COCMIDRAFT_83922, partial [Bipolaris oryzae ATCC 44560]
YKTLVCSCMLLTLRCVGGCSFHPYISSNKESASWWVQEDMTGVAEAWYRLLIFGHIFLPHTHINDANIL